MFNLEELNLPKLREVKPHPKYPNGLIIFNYNSALKNINLPELIKINTSKVFFLKCANLEQVICPKLQDLNIYIDNSTKKFNKLILGNKINKIFYYYKESANVKIPEVIQFNFDNYVYSAERFPFFTGSNSRYSNNYTTLPIPVEDLSNVVFYGKDISGINNVPNNYSKVKISTETFKDFGILD